MSRNESRTQGAPQAAPPPVPSQPQHEAPSSAFNFVVPTEVVDLPSKGLFYGEGHPLYGLDSIEVKHMTAKEEDILTSASLLKKGVALDKMLQSIIVDKRIKVEELLVGDKNALLIASRVYGYGAHYNVEVPCPACNSVFEHTFDLNQIEAKEVEDVQGVSKTENNTFVITLPKSNLEIEYRLLLSKDEHELSNKTSGGSLELLKLITASVNGQADTFYIERALQSMPILDVSVLKRAYAKTMPDIDMTQDVECTNCGETTEMGVPLDAGFFWPDS
jgi:hypothetical protein